MPTPVPDAPIGIVSTVPFSGALRSRLMNPTSTVLLTVRDTPASDPTSSNPCQRTVGWTALKPLVRALTASSAPPPPFVTNVPASGSSVGFAMGLAPPQLTKSTATSAPIRLLFRIVIQVRPPTGQRRLSQLPEVSLR